MSEYKFRRLEVAGKTVEVPQHWSDNAAKILATKYFKRAGVPTQMLGFLDVQMPMDLNANPKWGTNVETIVRAIITRQTRLWPDVDASTQGGEYSAHHVFLRLVLTWAHFGVRYGQLQADSTEILKFVNELYDDLYWQRAAPNSPQWFNTGLYYVYGISNPASGAYYIGEDGEIREVTDAYERPQAGACFIQKIEDSLDGILDFSVREARLFRHGSGSGANVSALRGANEPLSGGGVSSGLLSFLDIHDTVAGAIKSGGTTRRAAKMVTLDADHPDIEEFIDWKAKEELKVRALIEGSRVLREAGVDIEQFDSNWEGTAYRTVSGQNSNNSIMAKDEFMRLATNGDRETENWPLIGRVSKKPIKYVNAARLLRKIATAAWKSGDPALQFWDAINRANPTNEEFHATNPCLAGDTLIATSEGPKRIDALLDAPFQVVCGDGVLREVAPAFCTGIKPAMRLEFADGNSVRCTLDHLIKTVSGYDVEAHKLKHDDEVVTLDGTTKVTSMGYYGDVIKVYDITEPVTHHFFANNICVHNCSEYVFVDDSACNLASINLCRAGNLSFVGGVGSATAYFDDATEFVELVSRWTRVLDITVDMSQYPSRAIAINSRDYRPLGLGYANLGAYLMRQGLAYDSDAARAQIRVITRCMTQCAAEVSAHLASILGTYPKYDTTKHSKVFNNILNTGEPYFPQPALTKLRNAQLSLLAPCGCLVPQTLVHTQKGLRRLGRLGDAAGDQWQDTKGTLQVQTDEGPQDATRFFVNGVAQTRRVQLKNGVCIQGTPNHRIKKVTPSGGWSWVRLDAVEVGDLIPVQLGGMFGVPQEVVLHALGDTSQRNTHAVKAPSVMTADLAEWLGLFAGNGSLHDKGVRFEMFKEDLDAVARIGDLAARLFGIEARPIARRDQHSITVYVNSEPLACWMSAFSKADGLCVPDEVLETNDPTVYGAYLRGVFITDGTVGKSGPSVSTAQSQFAQDIISLLHALEIPCTLDNQTGGLSHAPVYRVRVPLSGIAKFNQYVGLANCSRKQARMPSPKAGRPGLVPIPAHIWDTVCPIGDPERDRAHRKAGVWHASRLVLERLHARTQNKDLALILSCVYTRVVSNEDSGQAMTLDLSVPANVTYLANGLISHNTIGFVMDCDTTGIEPDFSLVKFKQLAGGGYMNIINQSVEIALSSLGYENDDIDRIKHYLMEEIEVNGFKAPRNTLEGCPWLLPEHLPVFDCATAGGGTRSISWRGHLAAMAAAQPYLNGAISKTVNMPAESTIEDMEAAYVAAWKMGLKAVALYRDGSKNSQPLTTGASKQTSPADVTPPQDSHKARRESLPNKRKGYTQKLDVGGQKVYLRTGEYTDGRLGEIFIDVARQGDTTRSLMNAVAVALSIGLQHGVPLGEYIDAFIGSKFEPNGVVRGHDSITMASSLLDAIVRDLELNYDGPVSPTDELPAEITPAPAVMFNDMAEERELARRRGFEDAVCSTCQSRTLVRNGACMKCVTCGNTTGCS